jgi:hypothetical protein
MKGLFALAMKGRTHAIVGTVVTAVMALLITPVSVVSAGLVVLATLRNGAREGALVVVASILVLALLGGVAFQMPLELAGLGVTLWLPAWALATVLGRSGSLMRTLETAVVLGFVLIGLQYLLLDSPAAFWGKLLQAYVQQALDPTVVTPDEQKALVAAISVWMPGGVASSWTLSMALALLFGRWGQASLDNPGAFGREFRALRASRAWLFVLPVLLGGSLIGSGANIAGQFYLVGMVLYLLQGLSLGHGLVAATGANTGWLFGMYFLLFVGLPHSVTALAAAGYADGWLDFRAKVRGTGRPPGSE